MTKKKLYKTYPIETLKKIDARPQINHILLSEAVHHKPCVDFQKNGVTLLNAASVREAADESYLCFQDEPEMYPLVSQIIQNQDILVLKPMVTCEVRLLKNPPYQQTCCIFFPHLRFSLMLLLH